MGDSKLVISQILGEWKVNPDQLLKYHTFVTSLISEFESVIVLYIPRSLNRLADSLATLTSIVRVPISRVSESFVIQKLESPAIRRLSFIPEGYKDPSLSFITRPEDSEDEENSSDSERSEISFDQAISFANHYHVSSSYHFIGHITNEEEPLDDNPWFFDIFNYLQYNHIPSYASKSDRRSLRDLARRYTIVGGQLYKKSFDGILLDVSPSRKGKTSFMRPIQEYVGVM